MLRPVGRAKREADRAKHQEKTSEGVLTPTFCAKPDGRALRLATLATKAFASFALMGGMPIVRPLFPTDIHFLNEESTLCQLQSCFCRRLSFVPPAVSDNFFISGQN